MNYLIIRDLLHFNTESKFMPHHLRRHKKQRESKKSRYRSPLSLAGLDIKINPYNWVLFVHLDFCREKKS